MPPDISVVVCTHNRAARLPACLDALARTCYHPRRWELVVVNNGSTDDTDHVLKRWAYYYHRHLSIMGVSCPARGLSAARNAGIHAASAPLIACTDDDCYPAPDWLDMIVDQFRASVPRVHGPFDTPVGYGYLGGRVELHDPTDAPITLQRRPYPIDWSPGTFPIPGDMHGANMAFRKAVWQAVGGFDPTFGPGSRYVCDDIDFLTRASLAGYWGTYIPDAVVTHHHGRKPGRDTALLARTYDRGRGAYFAKQIMTSGHSRLFARHWYWSLRLALRQGRVGACAREGWAALGWAWRHGPGHSKGPGPAARGDEQRTTRPSPPAA